MKKIFILISLLCCIEMVAQVPAGINYQSVIRGNDGLPLANQTATFQFNYVDKSDNSIDFIELFPTTSDEFGVVNFVLGTGTSQTNSFASLDWTKQFRIDIFVNLGNGFTILGSQDLMSVPYALNAGHADMTLGDLTDVDTDGASSGNILMFDGSTWIPADISGSGGFDLPYLGNDPNLVSFGISNTSALGGSAIYGQTAINATNATGVRGQSTGASGRGVYGSATGASAYGILGENTVGTAIRGVTSGAGANGVHGIGNNANSIGVRGESADGTGVLAYSSTGDAIVTSTLTGNAINTSSTSGYAITSSGNIKIAGGNTNPGAGKVLTSDAQGNATWQTISSTPKIAFRADGPTTSLAFPSGAETKMLLDFERYDIGNNYDAANEVFTAPIAGLYHFDAASIINIQSNTNNLVSSVMTFVIIRNGTEIQGASTASTQESNSSSSTSDFSFGADLLLLANDQVVVKIFQFNYADESASFSQWLGDNHYFSGHLVFAN